MACSSPPSGRSDVVRASLLMLVVAVSTAIDAAVVRIVVADMHPFEIGFFRNLFSLLLMMPWLARAGFRTLHTRLLSIHVLRAGLKLGALVAFFYAISIMPLANVAAIGFTTPLFGALGAVLFLSETMGARRWGAVLLGFVGVLIVLRPGADVFDLRMLSALAAAIGLAGVALLLKFLAGREALATIVGLNLLLTVPMALLIALPVWQTPEPRLLGWLAVQGCLGACAQLAIARAMALADVSVLLPIEFVRLPLVVIIAYLAFGEIADAWTWIGGAVIFAATVYLAHREARLALDPSRRVATTTMASGD